MSRRLLILRNVLKVWLVLAAFALLLGALGWELGGYRVGILFIASAVLLAAATTTTIVCSSTSRWRR